MSVPCLCAFPVLLWRPVSHVSVFCLLPCLVFPNQLRCHLFLVPSCVCLCIYTECHLVLVAGSSVLVTCVISSHPVLSSHFSLRLCVKVSGLCFGSLPSIGCLRFCTSHHHTACPAGRDRQKTAWGWKTVQSQSAAFHFQPCHLKHLLVLFVETNLNTKRILNTVNFTSSFVHVILFTKTKV